MKQTDGKPKFDPVNKRLAEEAGRKTDRYCDACGIHYPSWILVLCGECQK